MSCTAKQVTLKCYAVQFTIAEQPAGGFNFFCLVT